MIKSTMIQHLRRAHWLLAALTLIIFPACHREVGPPTPLAVEQIPAELLKAYAKAKPDVLQIVNVLNSSLQSKDYTASFQAVQVLCNDPVATKEQRSVAVRAMLTINGLLQTAQAQGDV